MASETALSASLLALQAELDAQLRASEHLVLAHDVAHAPPSAADGMHAAALGLGVAPRYQLQSASRGEQGQPLVLPRGAMHRLLQLSFDPEPSPPSSPLAPDFDVQAQSLHSTQPSSHVDEEPPPEEDCGLRASAELVRLQRELRPFLDRFFNLHHATLIDTPLRQWYTLRDARKQQCSVLSHRLTLIGCALLCCFSFQLA